MNKLLREGLLVDTNSGYKLPKEYDDLAVTSNKSGGYNVEGVDSTQLTERQRIIYDTIKNYTQVTAKEMADTLADTLAVTLSISKRTVEREISFLRNNGFIRKEGKKNKGFWVVLK